VSETWRDAKETRELKFMVDLSPEDHLLRHGMRTLRIGYVAIRYEWKTGGRWVRTGVNALESGSGWNLACVRWRDMHTVPAWLQAIVDRADREVQALR